MLFSRWRNWFSVHSFWYECAPVFKGHFNFFFSELFLHSFAHCCIRWFFFIIRIICLLIICLWKKLQLFSPLCILCFWVFLEYTLHAIACFYYLFLCSWINEPFSLLLVDFEVHCGNLSLLLDYKDYEFIFMWLIDSCDIIHLDRKCDMLYLFPNGFPVGPLPLVDKMPLYLFCRTLFFCLFLFSLLSVSLCARPLCFNLGGLIIYLTIW